MVTTIISSIFPNIKSCFQLYYSINNYFQCPVLHFFIVNTSTLLIEDMIQYLTFIFTLSICNRDLGSILRSYPFSIVFLLQTLSLFSIIINLAALYQFVTDMSHWSYTDVMPNWLCIVYLAISTYWSWLIL